MTEVELKFQVPEAQRAAVARAMAGTGSRQVRLQAHYFDTADRRLARAGLALRVRREGRRWVQTLKCAPVPGPVARPAPRGGSSSPAKPVLLEGGGDGIWQRLEHEVPLGAARGVVPTADPARHDGTSAGDALRAALGDAPLAPTYGTEVVRRIRLLHAGDAAVELAFDTGALWAGARRWPLCELEFELKDGEVAALAAAAEPWVERHGLTLDVRSKAERGDRLARGVEVGEPVRAQALRLPEAVTADSALRAIAGNCLAQILGNASELAHGPATPEHLHQLRVGIRRLRSALRELGALSPQVQAGWPAALEALFRHLGAARDRDALAQTLLPALHEAGAAGLELPAVDDLPPPQLLGAPQTTRLWLQLLAFAAGSSGADAPFAPPAAQRLQALHRQVRRDARRFAALDDLKRHRLRKRLKRLRYLCEFVASMHEASKVKAYLERLAPAQEALGEFNDICVARALLQSLPDDPKAQFALGWLAHEHDDAVRRCRRPLVRLRKASPFW